VVDREREVANSEREVAIRGERWQIGRGRWL
jgi:hypothetical protein